jgi:hypothetical protein
VTDCAFALFAIANHCLRQLRGSLVPELCRRRNIEDARKVR